MPYVRETHRWNFGLTEIENVVMTAAFTPGDLNYLFTKLAILYVDHKGLTYTHLNDVVGALESAKAEFQRRMVAPYEDMKKAENGDVYGHAHL